MNHDALGGCHKNRSDYELFPKSVQFGLTFQIYGFSLLRSLPTNQPVLPCLLSLSFSARPNQSKRTPTERRLAETYPGTARLPRGLLSLQSPSASRSTTCRAGQTRIKLDSTPPARRSVKPIQRRPFPQCLRPAPPLHVPTGYRLPLGHGPRAGAPHLASPPVRSSSSFIPLPSPPRRQPPPSRIHPI